MVMYLIFILGGDFFICLFNCLFSVGNYPGLTYFKVILYTELLTVAVILVDGLFAFIARHLPEKYFRYDSGHFHPSKRSLNFWKGLGVKYWKDHVVELGMFTNFSKSHVSDPEDPEYIKHYILEANYGVVCHILDVVFGFLILLFIPPYWKIIALPIAIINAFLNFLPIGILRYNNPRLYTLLKICERKNKNNENRGN